MRLFRKDVEVRGIARDTLEFIFHACRSTHPHEFAGILRAVDGVISDVLVVPGTTSNEVSATLQIHMLPLAAGDVGSVHSHPSRSIRPSRADLNMFRGRGNWHIIVGYPYKGNKWACYDALGRPRSLPVIDMDFDDSW